MTCMIRKYKNILMLTINVQRSHTEATNLSMVSLSNMILGSFQIRNGPFGNQNTRRINIPIDITLKNSG